MSIVQPFQAVRFNTDKTHGALKDVVCPPYDVIDPAMQDKLYGRNPFNIVRVEFGRTSAQDSAGNDRYSRAAETFRAWLRDGILREDAKPSFYVYEQTFDIASGGASRSRVVTRRGFFGALKLEPFGAGSVFAHEETFGGPKADRLSLMKACSANLSPIFGLFPDSDNTMTALLARATQSKASDAEAVEENGVVNRLWVIDDSKWCSEMAATIRERNCFIADGHHRYETSCNYREERRNAGPAGGEKSYDFTLMMCVPMSDPGLYILPTHRLIQNAPGLSKDSFLAAASQFFDQRDASESELLALAEDETGGVRFGVIFQDGSRKILTVKSEAVAAMAKAAPAKSAAWRDLDVSVLQELVLKGLLKLSEEKVLRKEGVSYTPDTRLAIQKVTAPDSGYVMGFVLRPTRIDQVRDVAAGGEKMPQKSTYFYPKLLTGLVIRKLD